MKKAAKFNIILVFVLLLSGIFLGCTNISEEELSVVGRYELYSIEGITPDELPFSTSSFDRNYIILSRDKSFIICNFNYGLESKAKGKWSLNGETLTLQLSGFFAKKEKYTLIDDSIILKGIRPELKDVRPERNLTMTYIKVSE